MIRFACPTCAAVFTVPDEKGGKPGKCTKCAAQFMVPDAPAAAAAPAEAVEIAPCPKCQARLSIDRSELGASVECPYCRAVYAARLPGGATPAARRSSYGAPPAEAPPPRPSRRAAPPADEVEDDDFADEPVRTKRKGFKRRPSAGGRRAELRQIDALSAGKVFGIYMFVYGCLIAVVLAFVSLFIGFVGGGAGPNGAARVFTGMAFCYIFFIPLVFGMSGFLSGLMTSLAYNTIAKFVGGVVVEIAEE